MDEAVRKRKKLEKKERIARILQSGRKVFIKRGYFGATVREIARNAQMSTGAIYFYFKGKDDIYGRICEEGFQILLSLLRKGADIEGTVLEKIASVYGAYLKFYTEYSEYSDILLFQDLGFKQVDFSKSQKDKIETFSYEALSVAHTLVVEGIKDGSIYFEEERDPWEMTFVIWASFEGLIFIHRRGYLDTFNLDLNTIAKLVMRSAQHGLKNKNR
ncbi:TetR/AcrR family transcriptional regulator [Desulfocicer niacini]